MLELTQLKSVYDKENAKTIEKHQNIQERKLIRLCSTFSTSLSINTDDVIFNFSSRILTLEEKNLLAKGLNFSIPNNKLDYCNLLVPFEFLHRQLRDETICKDSGFIEDHFMTKLKDIALSGYRNISSPNFLLTCDDYQIPKNFKDDSGILIMKPDRGSEIV